MDKMKYNPFTGNFDFVGNDPNTGRKIVTLEATSLSQTLPPVALPGLMEGKAPAEPRKYYYNGGEFFVETSAGLYKQWDSYDGEPSSEEIREQLYFRTSFTLSGSSGLVEHNPTTFLLRYSRDDAVHPFTLISPWRQINISSTSALTGLLAVNYLVVVKNTVSSLALRLEGYCPRVGFWNNNIVEYKVVMFVYPEEIDFTLISHIGNHYFSSAIPAALKRGVTEMTVRLYPKGPEDEYRYASSNQPFNEFNTCIEFKQYKLATEFIEDLL